MLYTGTLELSRIAPYPVECQDHVKGVQLIEEAANLGNIKAIYQLRDLYADTDIDKYEYWGGKLVSRRDADAALDLAKAYLEGQANPYLDQSSADFLRFVEASKMLHEAAQLRSLKALTMWNLQAWGRKTDLSHGNAELLRQISTHALVNLPRRLPTCTPVTMD